jgi:hypothetical protein
MKSNLHTRAGRLLVLILWFFPSLAWAQWQTATYEIKAGYNGIYLFVDASHAASLNALLGSTPIDEVWLWKVDLSAAQFATSPQQPVDGGSRWLVWKKGKPAETTLKTLLGNTAYLIKSSSDFQWKVKGKPVPPRYQWTSKGQNLIGFSTPAGQPPNFDSFLSKVPGLVQDLEIFAYQGGPLGASNPDKVRALRTTNVDRGKAFWIRSKAGRFNRYFGPVEVELQNIDGVHFGDRLSQYRIVIRNLTQANLTVSMDQLDSESAPTGQTAIVGRPPLLVRGALNPTSLKHTFSALNGAVSWTLKPQGEEGAVEEIVIGVDRRTLGGAEGALYAGLLRFTDSLGFTQIDVGTSATKNSLAGLWVGDVNVAEVRHDLKRAQTLANGVNRLDANGKVVISGSTTSFGKAFRPYPLRIIVHVSGDGKMTLLQRVFYGFTDGFQARLATKESLISKKHLALSKRISAVHLPWTQANTTWAFLGGSFGPGQSIQAKVNLGHNDHPSNPFLHTYHPDHDNRKATFNQYQSRGIESYDVERTIALSLATPSEGFGDVTRSHQRLGGTYGESVTFKGSGNQIKQYDVRGTFVLNRISTIKSLTTE